jgi:hypothetical protein
MPLLCSTSAANAAHVVGSRAFTVYVGSAIEPNLRGATGKPIRPELAAPLGVWLLSQPDQSAAGRPLFRPDTSQSARILRAFPYTFTAAQMGHDDTQAPAAAAEEA